MPTVTLEPTLDAMISSLNPNTRYDTNPSMIVGTNTQGGDDYRRGILRFDLSSLPAYQLISITTSSLTITGTVNFTGTKTFSLYRQAQPTATTSVTWTNYATGSAWTTAGGDYTTGVLSTDTAVDPDASIVFSGNGLASLILDAIANRSEVFDAIIIGPESSGVQAYFDANSDEGATPPSLSITYDALLEPRLAWRSGMQLADWGVRP